MKRLRYRFAAISSGADCSRETGCRPKEFLASALGTSRVVVREALRSLEAVGLIESRAGSGRYLCAFDSAIAARTFASALAFHPAALLDLLAVRRAIESEVADDAARLITDADLAEMDAIVGRMRDEISNGISTLAREDSVFHRKLVAASGNQVALALIDLFWGVMHAVYRSGFPGPDATEALSVVESHGEIVAALRRRDGDATRRALVAHQREAERRFATWQEANDEPQEAGSQNSVQVAVQEALLGLAEPVPSHRKRESAR